MSLSAASAWDETAALARRAPLGLFGIAFLFLALPGAILQALAPAASPGRVPEPGLWLLFLPIPAFASLVGALAISRLAFGPDQEEAESALAVGLRRLPALTGAALLVLAALLLLGSLAALLASLAASLAAPPLLTGLPFLACLILLLWLWSRLILLTPAAAAEPLGPVGLIRRSWTLTAGHGAAMLGVLLVLLLLSLMVLVAARAGVGTFVALAFGPIRSGAGAAILRVLVSALLQAAVGGLFAAFVARLYVALAAGR